MANGFSELFISIAEWSVAKGADRINTLPGCWEHVFEFEGKPALVAINGHDDGCKSSEGMTVPPYSAVVSINGWPAVVCGPGGGGIMVDGDDTEGRLIDAFKAGVQPSSSGGET